MIHDDDKRILRAMKHIRETGLQPSEIQDGTVEAAPDQEAELWVDLLRIQMGIGPIRRKMATSDAPPEEST